MEKILTADCDVSNAELGVMMGGNGDWYVVIEGKSYDGLNHSLAVRICNSGGFHSVRLRNAVAELHAALQDNGGRKEGYSKELIENLRS